MKTNLKRASVMTFILLLWAGLMSALVQAGETVTYYHPDGLGSPAAATDSTGNVVWQEEYQAYGTRIRQQGTVNNSLWYTGKFHEETTGLTYFGARWYDPVVGRFMGVDPAGYQEGNVHSFNRYAYANNNPHRFVDPDGRVPVDTIWDGISIVYDVTKIGVGYVLDNPRLIQDGSVDLAADTIALAVPYLPAGSTKLARMAGAKGAAKDVPDSTIVCRGGSCSKDAFTNGKGVVTDPTTGNLSGVSTGIGDSVAAASKSIPHSKVGVTTAGDIRAAGGQVVNDRGNHADVSGVTAEKAAELFKDVVKNPNK